MRKVLPLWTWFGRSGNQLAVSVVPVLQSFDYVEELKPVIHSRRGKSGSNCHRSSSMSSSITKIQASGIVHLMRIS